MSNSRTNKAVLQFNKQKSFRPVVIITGCSSGIGYELAKQFYKIKNFCVVATCRSRSLEKLKSEFKENDHFIVRELDLLRDDNIYSLIHEIQLLWGRIDVVVNNAAVCYRAVVEHMDVDSELLQLQTNYLGPMSLTRAVLPIMREQHSGHIINVSSVSGMLAMPTMGSYSASKHALEGATEALWYEAKPFGIHVNLLQLGFINSKAHHRVILSHKAKVSCLLSGPHSEYYSSMGPMIDKLMGLSISSPDYVARKIIALIQKPSSQLRLAITPDAILFRLAKKLIPAALFHRILYFFLPNSKKWGERWSVAKSSQQLQSSAKLAK